MQKVTLEHKAQLVQLDLWVLKGLLVLRVILEHKVLKVLKALRVT